MNASVINVQKICIQLKKESKKVLGHIVYYFLRYQNTKLNENTQQVATLKQIVKDRMSIK